ncbi:hypothetical protein N7462_004770 [Penicillium macrosclerotiorum]|uniref:uncharacterized protein n=1 Tax=Penicillium macrosclerotiorum TaxID=303699 RepID=UPI002549B0E3|nr:uncharacterized protein N7462_004770 [Penicillium macrosclerotiorum]KAJ5690378.1 hypothetical protein N7462_004770 [Penicillium macrosclerotiorum]
MDKEHSLTATVQAEFTAAGFSPEQIQKVLRQQQQLEERPPGAKQIKIPRLPMMDEVLRSYSIPSTISRDRKYYVVEKWMSAGFIDLLVEEAQQRFEQQPPQWFTRDPSLDTAQDGEERRLSNMKYRIMTKTDAPAIQGPQRWFKTHIAPSDDDVEKHPRQSNGEGTTAGIKTSLFSVRALSHEISPISGENIILVAADHHPKQAGDADTKWLHVQHQGISFGTFLKAALDASGLGRHIHSAVNHTFQSVLPRIEKSFVFGRYFLPVVLSRNVVLPHHRTSVEVMFMTIPYFFMADLIDPRKRNTGDSKVHSVRALVQSLYHLDSSTARENQQAFRRVHPQAEKAVVHIPQLWVVTLGSSFFATCSPTPVFNHPSSAIVTCGVEENLFPPIIRVSTSTGVFFCLDRASCVVWLEFLGQVRRAIEIGTGVITDPAHFSFRLPLPNGHITAKRWPEVITAHSDDKILNIFASLPSNLKEVSPVVPVAIPLEDTQTNLQPGSASSESPQIFKADIADLSPDTLDVYRLPWHYEEQTGPQPKSVLVVEKPLSEFDQKILLNHTRRCKSREKRPRKRHRQRNSTESPLYAFPARVQEALQSFSDITHGETEEWKSSFSPILSWPVFTPEDVVDISKVTPSRQMKCLLANLHFELLFWRDQQQACSYNALPLCSKDIVEHTLERLGREEGLSTHQTKLLASFIQRVSGILDLFILANYDCVVKGKVWSAVDVLLSLFRSRFSSSHFALQCDILAIPMAQILQTVRSFHAEVLCVQRNYYMPTSLMQAFKHFVLALVEVSSNASRLMNEDEYQNEPESGEWADWGDDEDSELYGRRSYSRKSLSCSSCSSCSSYLDFDPSDETESTPNFRRGRGSRRKGNKESIGGVHFYEVINMIEESRNEMVCILQPDRVEDQEQSRMVDRGTLISLVLESILSGHSGLPSMPKINLEEIYLTWTTRLRLNIRNKPSRSHLSDLNLLREELDSIIATVEDQLSVLRTFHEDDLLEDAATVYSDVRGQTQGVFLARISAHQPGLPNQSTIKLINRLANELKEKKEVYTELHGQVARMEKQVVQWTEMIQEDHGKAIMVFTIVSIIFLPLSFVTSYLGMNTADIRDMGSNQNLFWEVAVPFTFVVGCVVLGVVYNADRIMGLFPGFRSVRSSS